MLRDAVAGVVLSDVMLDKRVVEVALLDTGVGLKLLYQLVEEFFAVAVGALGLKQTISDRALYVVVGS